jgi:hypothetical protein
VGSYTPDVTVDDLWGAIIDGFTFDLTTQTMGLSIKVVNGERTESFRLVSSGITRMEFTNGIEGPWNYVELTAASLEDDGRRRALELWSDSCTLIFDGAMHEIETVDGRTLLTG